MGHSFFLLSNRFQSVYHSKSCAVQSSNPRIGEEELLDCNKRCRRESDQVNGRGRELVLLLLLRLSSQRLVLPILLVGLDNNRRRSRTSVLGFPSRLYICEQILPGVGPSIKEIPLVGICQHQL